MVSIAFVFLGTVAAVCVPRPEEGGGPAPEPSGPAGDLPLLKIGDFDYVGAFAMSGDKYGVSNLDSAHGVIEKAGDSLFIIGHQNKDAIAEFIVPDLVDSTDLSDLNSTGDPVQVFSTILDKPQTGNPQGLDYVTGMEVHEGKLIVNAHRFYDGGADNTHTTLVISDAGDIAGSTVDGYYELPGGPKSGGWISPVPPEWRAAVGTAHLTGYASSTAINSRHSLGPSAHSLNLSDVLDATVANPAIPTVRMLEYSLGNPLNTDLFNESLQNDLWTYDSGAVYGFIVPGTRTYAVLGWSGGHESGLGYKITQSDGNECGGYCPPDPYDLYNYYWLYDVRDLLAVKAGETAPADVRPYEYGEFVTPFQPDRGVNKIGGGTFDPETGTLYVSVLNADREQGRYKEVPVVVAYRFPGF